MRIALAIVLYLSLPPIQSILRARSHMIMTNKLFETNTYVRTCKNLYDVGVRICRDGYVEVVVATLYMYFVDQSHPYILPIFCLCAF